MSDFKYLQLTDSTTVKEPSLFDCPYEDPSDSEIYFNGVRDALKIERTSPYVPLSVNEFQIIKDSGNCGDQWITLKFVTNNGSVSKVFKRYGWFRRIQHFYNNFDGFLSPDIELASELKNLSDRVAFINNDKHLYIQGLMVMADLIVEEETNMMKKLRLAKQLGSKIIPKLIEECSYDESSSL